MAGITGVGDGTGPLLLHVDGTTAGGITTSGMTTSGMVNSAGSVDPSIGIAKLLPGISASSASASTGAGILAGLAVVGSVLLTGALFAGVGLLSYAITKAAIEP